MKRISTSVLMLIMAFIVKAQPGAIDLSFNPGDIGFGYGYGPNSSVYASVLQPDGKILIGGSFTSYNETSRNRIARLNADGTLDITFNPGTGVTGVNNTPINNMVYAIALQPDGKILIGGTFISYNGTSRNNIARLNADGTIDTTFNPGTGAIGSPTGSVRAIALQPDGKIIIGGEFFEYNGMVVNNIARLHANGTFDNTFLGTGANSSVRAITLQPDEKILIGGSFSSYNGTSRNCIARLNSNGTLDNIFDPGTGVTGVNNTVYAIALQTDEKIIIGGQFSSYNGTARNNIARLNANGSLDNTFNLGSGANTRVYAIALQPNGKIIIGGDFISYNVTSINRIARLNADGTIDNTFNPGTGANASVRAIALQPDGKILIGGDFPSYNAIARYRIARINAAGTIDNTFNPGTGANYPITCFSVQADGKIIIGGGFSYFNGTARNYIARLNSNGTLDNTFNPGTGANALVQAIALQADGKIIIGGGFSYFNGTARNYIARLNSNGTLDNTFNPGTGANALVQAIAIQPDGKILIGGHFSSYSGTSRNFIARLNSNGTLDNSFNPGTGANSSVYAIALQPDGKILIGGLFTYYNGVATNRIVRLNADGSFDFTFNSGSGANNTVYAITLQPDGKIIIGGDFSSYNGTSRTGIARLNANGTLDNTFNPGTGASGTAQKNVETIALQPDEKILIGGGFTIYNGVGTNRIARLNVDGTIDNTFNPGTGANNSISAIAFQPDGKIIIGGEFSSYFGIGRNHIARLFSQCVSSFGTNTISACGQYTWLDGITYTESNDTSTYTIIGGASNGCDSIVSLYLTIYQNFSFVQNEEICDGDMFLWRGNAYTLSGTYYDSLLTAHNCDSLYVLNLTVHQTFDFLESHEICDGDVFTWRGNAYTLSGTYYDSLLTAHNCDSVHALNLIVNDIPPKPVVSLSGNMLTSDASTGNQWYDQNGLIPGETNQFYIVTSDGNYYVIVTLSGCSSDPSDTISVNVSVVDFVYANRNIKVYPNPVSDELIIEIAGNSETLSFEIYNSMGQVVFNGNFVEKTTVHTSNFNPGVYYIKIQKENSSPITTSAIKIIIN